MILVKLSKIILEVFVILFLLLLGACETNTNIEQCDAVNVLMEMESKFTEDESVLQVYSSDILSAEEFNCSYGIEYFYYDLNGDGTDEIISYFMSSLNSGSSGNFHLDIWIQEDNGYINIGPTTTIFLNPRLPNITDISLTISNKKTNGFYEMVYSIDNAEGFIRTSFPFDGLTYVKAE